MSDVPEAWQFFRPLIDTLIAAETEASSLIESPRTTSGEIDKLRVVRALICMTQIELHGLWGRNPPFPDLTSPEIGERRNVVPLQPARGKPTVSNSDLAQAIELLERFESEVGHAPASLSEIRAWLESPPPKGAA